MRFVTLTLGLVGLALFSALVFGQVAPPTTGVGSEAPDDEAFLALGQSVYEANCMTCHGSTGGGGVGVPLAGNDYLAETDYVIEQILFGGGFMPGFGHLSDEEVAAVASDVRTSWGNDFGLVTPEEVAESR